MEVPSKTVDFIKYLEKLYPDKYDVLPETVGTQEYWMRAGIIELIRRANITIEKTPLVGVTDKEA